MAINKLSLQWLPNVRTSSSDYIIISITNYVYIEVFRRFPGLRDMRVLLYIILAC